MTAWTAEVAVELSGLEDELDGPAVVAIGGGHGLAAALAAARTYASDITAVVSVADDGGSSGRLISGLGIPPPGDIRRCLLALTPDRSVWSDLFAYRFDGPAADPQDVLGHSLGNLLIAALTDLSGGDFAAGVARAGALLGAMGRVVPAADRPMEMSAVVGGRTVTGQDAIAKARGGITELSLGPADVRARPEAVAAIQGADQIIIGPGSLFTSVIAALEVPGMSEAVDGSPATLVHILNLTTQDAETLGMSAAEHIAAIHRHTGLRRTGTILAHAGELDLPEPIDPVGVPDPDEVAGWRVVTADIARIVDDWPVHDPVEVGRRLSELVM